MTVELDLLEIIDNESNTPSPISYRISNPKSTASHVSRCTWATWSPPLSEVSVTKDHDWRSTWTLELFLSRCTAKMMCRTRYKFCGLLRHVNWLWQWSVQYLALLHCARVTQILRNTIIMLIDAAESQILIVSVADQSTRIFQPMVSRTTQTYHLCPSLPWMTATNRFVSESLCRHEYPLRVRLLSVERLFTWHSHYDSMQPRN